MMRLYNESTGYVSQGGGKRKGSMAVYVEPWHADIESAILSQKQQGAAEMLCRDLFLALWVPDLFMQRLKQSLKTKEPVSWSLMCPHECPGLTDTYGEEFEQLYLKYENKGQYRRQVNIHDLWRLIMLTQIETGKPYLMCKDNVNRKCNEGVIKSSNLCVSGDTRILTDKGYICISDVAGQTVKIWDTTKFIDAPVRQTGTNQRLLEVTTDDGCELKCTGYHRFVVRKIVKNIHHVSTVTEVVKEARELAVGDIITSTEFPIIEGNPDYDMKYPYTHGFFCGDGIKYNRFVNYAKRVINESDELAVCEDMQYPFTHGFFCGDETNDKKQSLVGFFDYLPLPNYNKAPRQEQFVLRDIAGKYAVPVNATIKNKLM